MKTKFFSWIVVILMGLTFAGCSKDDNGSEEDSGTVTSIVGTWKYVFSTGYGLITFNQNGTGVACEYDTDGNDEDPFTYIYDAEAKVLYINWIEETGDDELEICHIVSISKTTAIVDDGEGYTITLQRVK